MVAVRAHVEAEAGAVVELNTSQETIEPGTRLQLSVKLNAPTDESHWTREQIRISLKSARQALDREAYLRFREQTLAAVRKAVMDLHGADSIKTIVIKPWNDQPDESQVPIGSFFETIHMCFLPMQRESDPNNGLDATLCITVHRYPQKVLHISADRQNEHTQAYANAVLCTPGYPIR